MDSRTGQQKSSGPQDMRPPCKHVHPFTDEACCLVPPHDRLHLGAESGDRWFYDDPELEQKRRDFLAEALQRDAERRMGVLPNDHRGWT